MLVLPARSPTVIAVRKVLHCCAALALLASGAAQGETIYRVDGDGETVLLTDQSGKPGARVVVEAANSPKPAPTQELGPGIALPMQREKRFTQIVNRAASAQRIAPELLQAVIAVESGHAVRAVSPRGAQGLMQLMPATARAYGVTDPFDPQQNIAAGARHLRHLLDQFGQDTVLALAAYNAGAAAVVRHRNRIPPFAETVSYVPRVMRYFSQLQAAPTEPPLPFH